MPPSMDMTARDPHFRAAIFSEVDAANDESRRQCTTCQGCLPTLHVNNRAVSRVRQMHDEAVRYQAGKLVNERTTLMRLNRHRDAEQDGHW